VSTARIVFAGTLLCLSGVGFAQPAPATQSAVSGIFQNPPAATAGDAKSSASASTPGTNPSAKKTFNESRSNTARTPGDAKAVAPGAEPSGNKSFFESRSNTARQAEDKAKPAAGQAAAGAPGNPMVTNTAPAQPVRK
jgi:hypothetical protein